MKSLIYAGILFLLCVFLGCRAEDEGELEKITSIELDTDLVELGVNEEVIVRLTVLSEAAKRNEQIKFRASPEGFVEIREPTNDGFVLRGIKGGSTVIRIESQYVVKLLEVRVTGEDVLARYIKLEKPVIEVNEGSRVTTSVSLYGGIAEGDDNLLFNWQLETGKNNIGILPTGNIAAITGLQRGYQELYVSHPRSDFANKILVFVKGVDEEIKYIYRESNILMVPNDGQYHDFDVVLINGVSGDAVDFSYEVVQGQANIEEISGSQTKCNVLAKKSGSSIIRVSHPLAVVDFDVRVIIYDIDIPYIALDKSFVLLNMQESARVLAEVEYARNGVAHKGQFHYKIIENDEEIEDESQSIIEVIQTNESFYIHAKRAGTARLVISNEQAQMPREVLVVVREEAVYRDDYYITTTQNVITTQVGADMTRLYVTLVNGNSADANNFIWDVDDGTVITVYGNHGTIKYQSRAAIQAVFEAYVDIEPKKAGTARITVSNTKWPDTQAQIIVRVYPAGTFVKPPVQVGYDGLIKVQYGKSETVNLKMLSGSESEAGNLNWSIEDTSIATLFTNAHSMVNVLSAVKSVNGGITKMVVRGKNIEFPHESIVVAGSAEYIRNTQIIYVDNIYQKVVEQQTIEVPVLNSKVNAAGKPDESWMPYGFSVKVEKPNVLYAVMVQNKLKIMGKERGETDVIVSHTDAVNESITLHVRVEPMSISINQPYYISGNDIKGVVRTIPTEFSVSMPGAPESELSKLVWRSDDTSAVTVTGSGSSALLTGRVSGSQTKVWVSHKDNKAGEKSVLVYVVETADELMNVVLGAKQENYLLKTGQEQLVTVITNANDTQKKNIDWEVVTKPGDPVPITIDKHYDSAMVRAVAAGNAEIVVTYTGEDPAKYTLPLSIYVSVVDTLGEDKVIKGPAVIELLRGESKIVGLEHLNLTQEEIMSIRWAVESDGEPLANIEGNGDSAYLYGLRKGVGRVKIWQEKINYVHYATLVCANTPEELVLMYVMGVDSSYQKMLLGEEKKVKLLFGSKGFPETAKRNLVWEADSSGKVRVVGQGESVSIIAEDVGEATVTVRDKNNPTVSFNESLQIKFLVIQPGQSHLEFRGHKKMVGIITGQSEKVEMKLWDNDEEVKNYALWEHWVEDESENIITVNRVDGELDIRAHNVGQAYITVRYNKEVSARILVYTALTADGLENYYPILVEKINYLLQIGQTAVVKIETMEEKDREHFSKVSWGIENAGVIGNADFSGKKEVTVRGAQAGQCVISVNYSGQQVARIFITVVSNDEIDMTKYMVTENIIGMVLGEQRTTKIFSNLGSDVSKLVWESLGTGVVTVSGSGDEARLTAVGLGEAYVTVTYGSWLKRYIRVYVCADKNMVDAYKAMNMENQYYRSGLGETLVLPMYFAPNKSAVPTMWVDKYENKVVQFTPLENGSKIEINTRNEGVAVLEAVNTGLNDPSHVVRVYIEVSKKYNGSPRPVVERFLTISKTIYVMNPDEKDEELNLRVSGVGYTVEELAGVTWELLGSSGNYVSIYPNGQECRVRVNPVGKEGTAEIRASKTENEVLIKIIVSKTGMMGFPHIVGDDTVRVGMGSKVMVAYDVAEVGQYDQNSFAVQVMSGSHTVNARFNQNVLELEGLASGQALLRVSCVPVCSAAHYKDVAVLVTTTADGLVYLTTRNNFTQVKIEEVKTINVEMVGMENSGDAGYVWSIDEEDKDCLELNWTGRQAQVKGLEAGAGRTVKVTVKNTLYVDPLFDLIMYVRVSDNFFNTTYMTTAQNIVSVVQGRSMYLTVELVNGQPGEDGLITWESLNGDIAQVHGAGTQAYVLGDKVGFAIVQAKYAKAVNKVLEILVIVEKDTSIDGIYITSSDTMVQLKPGDTREISARLIGGGLGDEYGFRWQVFTQNPIIQEKQVVEIYGALTGTDRTYIRGLNEGEATIRVSHPARTQYTLDLKIYVQEYNKVEFDAQTLTVNQFEEKIVRVSMPPNTSVVYTLSKPGVVSLSDQGPTSSTYLVIRGEAPGICVITATSVEKVLTAEMIVTVKEVNNRLVQYIQTNDTIFNMIDWQSAANRVMVSGTPVGEKEGGGEFTDADSLGLEWEISSGSESIIGFDAMAGTPTRVTGKLSSIFSRRPGTAEIKVRHPEMKGYSKNIYINVTQYDANFILAPMFESMQIGDQSVFTVNITGNVDQSEYDEITWRLFPNEKNIYGVEFVDTEKKYEKEKGNNIKILATADGVYKIKAGYHGKEIEGIIYVEHKKMLEVYDESFVKIVPGSTVFIGLYHEPLLDKGMGLNINTDYNAFVDIGYAGPIKNDKNELMTNYLPVDKEYTGDYGAKYKYDIRNAFTEGIRKAILNQNYNALLVLHGKEREGYTRIKITYNNIERVVTVHNSMDYTFNMTGIVKNGKAENTSSVRGRPGDTVTIKYEIVPAQLEVKNGNDLFGTNGNVVVNRNGWLMNNNSNFVNLTSQNSNDAYQVVYNNYNNKNDNKNINIDSVKQEITIKLNRCGYTLLKFVSKINNNMEYVMEIPVYVYYEKMDLDWEFIVDRKSSGGNSLSRLDDLDNVIYIANKEVIVIKLDKSSDGRYVNKYDGDDFEIKSIRLNNVKVTKGNDNIYQGIYDGTFNEDIGVYEDGNNEILRFGFLKRDYNAGSIIGFAILGNVQEEYTKGNNSLLTLKYVGMMEVTYTYSNGGMSKYETTKRFIIYQEKWAVKN
jgi:hypothetical protein